MRFRSIGWFVPPYVCMSPDAFKTTLEEVGYDPYTLFLVQVWG
jgi:hypothetical protein